MKKTILVKRLDKSLVESSIKIGDQASEAKVRKRLTDLSRVAKMARKAAEKATKNNNEPLAKKLDQRADEIEELIRNYNIDTIDDEDVDNEDPIENSPKPEENSSQNQDFDDSKDETGEEETDSGSEESNSQPKETEGDNSDKKTTGGDSENDSEAEDKSDSNNLKDEDSEDAESSSTESESAPEDKDNSGTDDGVEGSTGSETSKEEGSEDESEEANNQPKEDNESASDDKTDTPKKDKDTDSTDDTSADSSEKEQSDDDSSEDSGGNKDNSNKSNDSADGDGDEGGNSGSSGGSDDGESSDEENKEEDEEEETADSPVNDPFATEDDIPTPNFGGGEQEPRDATLKDIIKQLKGLKGESKAGAVAALKDLIGNQKSSANESLTARLTEAVKGVREMTDDEFGDYINSTYDLIGEADDLEYVDDVEARKAKITDWANNPLTAQELAAEDNVEIQKDFQKKKALEREKARYNRVGTLDQFKLNFYNAVKDQVEMVRQEYQSYEEINPEYESEDVIMKADIIRDIPEEAIPVIDVYFDVSASWELSDIEIGKRAIASIKEFEDAEEIKLNIFYFGDDVSPEFHEVAGAGTTGWRKILQNIKATGAQNVVVMTDDDIEKMGTSHKYFYGKYAAVDGPTCKVDGCVWFLWKNGLSSPSCVQHLIGRQGNYQYSFNA